MKWYNSIKIKMIGFFLLISIVFLLSIVTTFFMMREQNLPQNASKEISLLTTELLQEVRSRQVEAEETVLSLASVGSALQSDIFSQSYIITAMLASHQNNTLNIVSGGLWFEPGIQGIPQKSPYLFFSRNRDHTFEPVSRYVSNFRTMAFYTLAKSLPKGKTGWISVYIDPVTHVKMITAVSPIYNGNRFIGTASIDIPVFQNIQQTLIKRIKHDNTYIVMLDNKGNFVGKSSLFYRFAKASNIYQIKNRNFETLMQLIAPVIKEGNDTTLCYSDEKNTKRSEKLVESICIVEEDPILHTSSVLAIYHFPRTRWNIIVGIPKAKVLEHYDALFYKILGLTVILTVLATIMGYFVLRYLFIKPVENINRQLQQALDDKVDNTLLVCKDKGEIGILVENLNTRTVNLQKARERESKEHQMRLIQEEMLVQQSKMAMVGEMMDSVAHQWKQPLNALTLYSELIRNDFEEGNVDQAYIEKFRKDIQLQIDHMVNTLDEFRSFFRPNKEKQSFKLIDVVNSALFLAKDDILKHHILVKIEQQDEIVIEGFPNEFKHLILNIINNAKDAFVERDIKQRLIRIALIASEEGKRMEICDNAGGIPETVIEKIFEANVTTKEEGKGTGIGLYMSRRIAQKHHARLQAENRDGGACFIVYFDSDVPKVQDAADLPAR